ncbi:MAG: alpha/beta hydrolase [Armatimonadetes bacterium]|nr:alpha/beta hydrolase [Armatimonadota bacterium]
MTNSCAHGPFPGTVSDYNGYLRHDFVVDGCDCLVVCPHAEVPGRHWIWRAEFFDHRPDTDLALLALGFHLAYMDVQNTFGCPRAMDHFDAFHAFLTREYGFHRRAVLEGYSRGGLYCYNWARRDPSRVACIYGDAPVCDFKSWPAGKGTGRGNPPEWEKLLRDYGFASEEEALAYDGNPVDNLAPLAAAGIPIIHVFGDADEDVPWEENTGVMFGRYTALGGHMELIRKPGVAHHPHSLDDPTPIVEFILKHTVQAVSPPATE